MTTDRLETRNDETITAFVDAHVHIHNCYRVSAFFDAAAMNFRNYSSVVKLAGTQKFVLCLTETMGTNRFEELATRSCEESEGRETHNPAWDFRGGSDPDSLIARHPVHGEIVVVAGRQIVTAERLELLALGSRRKWEDGLIASDAIDSVISSGAIPVLPWGFGKWLGRRRRTLQRLIEQFNDASLYLGDNGGRPRMISYPGEFTSARGEGMRILRGSDPLPFASEYNRAGSFGFYVGGLHGQESVWGALRDLLRRGAGEFNDYGRLESPLRFARNQAAIQYVTRFRNHWGAI